MDKPDNTTDSLVEKKSGSVGEFEEVILWPTIGCASTAHNQTATDEIEYPNYSLSLRAVMIGVGVLFCFKSALLEGLTRPMQDWGGRYDNEVQESSRNE
jgi:hypothetical protein